MACRRLAALAAATMMLASTGASHAASTGPVDWKDGKDPKAVIDLRKVTIGYGSEMYADVKFKRSEWGSDFPEQTDMVVWFNTDKDRKPEFRMRLRDGGAVYKVNKWGLSGGKELGDCFGVAQAFSATDVSFSMDSSCGKGIKRFKVHVGSFFTGDGPAPDAKDHAPDKAKGWSKAIAVK